MVSKFSRTKISSSTAESKMKVSSPFTPALMVVRERERRRSIPHQREFLMFTRKDQRLSLSTSQSMIHLARSRDWSKSLQTLLVPTWLIIQTDSPVEEPELCSTSSPQTVRDFLSQNRSIKPRPKKLLLPRSQLRRVRSEHFLSHTYPMFFNLFLILRIFKEKIN